VGILKDKIFSFFDYRDDVEDLYPVDGKGFEQRFQELIAGEIDDNEVDSIDNFNDNLIIPEQMINSYLIDKQVEKGIDIGISNDDDVNRKLIRYSQSIISIKGTKKSYKVLFKLLGLECDIIEHNIVSGFDSGNLDNPLRRFDSKCASCSDYTVIIYSTKTPQLERAVNKIIDFCEPIDAKLRELIFSSSGLQTGGINSNLQNFPTVHLGGNNTVNISATLQTGN
tara:strand:+ start:1175 stop:1849 length:675 start_codon:yes stop_codon:yes gene_type:complete